MLYEVITQFHVAFRVMRHLNIKLLQQVDIVFSQLHTVACQNVGCQDAELGKVLNGGSPVALFYLLYFAFGFGQVDDKRQAEGLRQLKCPF